MKNLKEKTWRLPNTGIALRFPITNILTYLLGQNETLPWDLSTPTTTDTYAYDSTCFTCSNTTGATTINDYNPGNPSINTGKTPAIYNYDPTAHTSTHSQIQVHYYGYRYYNPQLGRWLSRDPIGKRGGVNIYTAFINRPSSIVDVLGLWYDGKRDGDDWATVKASKDEDSIDELAEAVWLNASEAFGETGWLRTEDGHTVGSSKDIKACHEYRVPNTIVIVGGDIGFGLWPMHGHITLMGKKYRDDGFKTTIDHFATASEIRSAFNTAYLQGFIYFGHSDGTDIVGHDMPGKKKYKEHGFDWTKYIVKPSKIELDYKLGVVWIFACNAGLGKWDDLVS